MHWPIREIKAISYRTKAQLICVASPLINKIFRRRSIRKYVFNVVGDSHTDVFQSEGNFNICHIKQPTAYNLDQENSFSRSKEHLAEFLKTINKNDILMLVFGEIDARIHIYYQYIKNNKQISIEELICRTIERYAKVILRLKAEYKVVVYGIPPATPIMENQYNYPFYGSPEQRSEITKDFNQQLKSFTQSQGIPFIDIYSITADKKGFTKEEYRQDKMHLNKKIVPHIRKKLIEFAKHL